MTMIESEACEVRTRVMTYSLSNSASHGKEILTGDHDKVMFE